MPANMPLVTYNSWSAPLMGRYKSRRLSIGAPTLRLLHYPPLCPPLRLPPSLLPSPVAHSLLNGHQRKQRAAHSSTVAHCTAWFQYIFTSYNTNTKRQNTSNTHILHHVMINTIALDQAQLRIRWTSDRYDTSKDILLQWNLWVFTGVQIWLNRVIRLQNCSMKNQAFSGCRQFWSNWYRQYVNVHLGLSSNNRTLKSQPFPWLQVK